MLWLQLVNVYHHSHENQQFRVQIDCFINNLASQTSQTMRVVGVQVTDPKQQNLVGQKRKQLILLVFIFLISFVCCFCKLKVNLHLVPFKDLVDLLCLTFQGKESVSCDKLWRGIKMTDEGCDGIRDHQSHICHSRRLFNIYYGSLSGYRFSFMGLC